MSEKNSAEYTGPLSPEEKAECDRELEEMRRENLAAMRRDIDERTRTSAARYMREYLDEVSNTYPD